jgi:hypothetical protein
MKPSIEKTVVKCSEKEYFVALAYLESAWGGGHFQWFPLGEMHVRTGSWSDWHEIRALPLLEQHHRDRQAKLDSLPNPARIPGFGGY